MSLILDALRKADQERQSRERTPGIDAVYDTPPASSTSRGWWLVGILFCIILVLLVGLWILGAPQTAEHEPAKIITNDVAEIVEQPPEKITSVTSEVADSEPQPDAEIEPEAQFNRIYDAARDDVEAATTQAGDAAAQEPSEDLSNTAIAQLYRRDTDEQPAASVTEGKDAAPLETQAPAVENIQPPAVGNIRDLPLSVQNRIPTLMYAAHEYLQGDRPSVVLNSQRLYEGQTLQGGLRIERIEQDGVIISLDNHRFKLNALSSWVNM